MQHRRQVLRFLFSLIATAFLLALSARADTWSSWAQVPVTSGILPTLATDGTNIYYSTALDGVYRATVADRNFSLMPMTGFPLWDANSNTNGFALTHVAATPQGTVVISGSQISASATNITFNPPGSSQNTLPVFYWWDETNQLWHASGVTGRTYPYVGNVGNFSLAPDDSLWTCSGFATYAYRSTDGGKNFTAFDINARVPTNYFPLPIGGFSTFGEVFSIRAGWNNEVVIGTETGGYLHTTNNGTNWSSLDPNFTNTNSVNPLGRIGDARVMGLDHYGNFLLNNFLTLQTPAITNWNGVKLIAWRPRDGAYFPATNGFLAYLGAARVVTPSSGVSFAFTSQNYLLQGGIYRSLNGRDWSQFNQGTGIDYPFAPGLTNALGQAGGIANIGNLILIGTSSGAIYSFDSTPPPVVNRPPVALPQNVNLRENSPTNLTLTARDADGDALNFSIVHSPANGTLTGTPPNLTYAPATNFTGLDGFTFVADDSAATSAPVFVNFYVNKLTNTPSAVSVTSPTDGKVLIAPTNLTLTAAASDPDGITAVNFYEDNFLNLIGIATAPPYTIVLTNLVNGDHVYSARVFDGKGTRTWSAPVRVTVLPVAPRASIRQVDSENVAVTWPLALDGFFLETANDLNGPWTLAPQPQFYFTNGQTATIPKADQQFFRLMRPR